VRKVVEESCRRLEKSLWMKVNRNCPRCSFYPALPASNRHHQAQAFNSATSPPPHLTSKHGERKYLAQWSTPLAWLSIESRDGGRDGLHSRYSIFDHLRQPVIEYSPSHEYDALLHTLYITQQSGIYFLFPQMPPMKLLTPPPLLLALICLKLTADKSLLSFSQLTSSLDVRPAPALVEGLSSHVRKFCWVAFDALLACI
jgi:hypothetical protein